MQLPLSSELPDVSIALMVKIQLMAELGSFLNQMQNKKNVLRDNQMCLLQDNPKEQQCLLFYVQGATCHSRCITTASGYVRLFV